MDSNEVAWGIVRGEIFKVFLTNTASPPPRPERRG